MTRIAHILAALATACLVVPSVAGETPPPDGVAARARTVLKTYCLHCHHGEGSEGGDFDFRPSAA